MAAAQPESLPELRGQIIPLPTEPLRDAPTPAAPRFNFTMSALDLAVGALVKPFARIGGRNPEGFVARDLACVVAAIQHPATDVATLRLERADGQALPAWFPGAHVDVLLPEHLGGGMRQYSLNGDPNDLTSYRIGVRRIDPAHGGGGGSVAIHSLRPGDEVTLKGPRHAFPFIDAESYLFVAGGIGITPILPMLRMVAARGDKPWRLIYTGRTRDSMAFLDEIDEIDARAGRGGGAGALIRDRVHIWPDDEHGIPNGRRILELAPKGAALYTCGPTAMIDAIRAVIPDPLIDTLHYERFSPPPVRGGKEFPIRLAKRGDLVTVAADETALSAVRRVRPQQAYSCQQGFCGTCKVRVLAGEVDHRDRVLVDAERVENMMLCVSRGEGELILDL